MSGAISLFKMPANYARDNYPIVREGETSTAATPERTAARTETPKETTPVSAKGEREVTTAFTSLLRGERRSATA